MRALAGLVAFAVAAACAAAPAAETALPALYPAHPELSAKDILARAHEAAGGETWRRPKSLFMKGYAVFYRGAEATTYDDYRMWRVYPSWKGDAHRADGKVRIEGRTDGRTALLIAFDGETTYDMKGPVADQTANAQWAENFGFGAIRYGLDEGWGAKRLPDDIVDGRPAHMIELQDPAGGVTRFGIAADDFAILYVGFDTPRGWHERRYSDFFSRPGASWVQPGRVRLFYDGVKQNEVLWTDFELNRDMDDALFVVRP